MNKQIPTEISSQMFLYENSGKRKFNYQIPTGKWCIFLKEDEVNAAWETIKEAVINGDIVSALVSTKEQAKQYGGTYVICAFADSYHSEIKRVRQVLDDLGFANPLKYKLDSVTAIGIMSGPEEWLIIEE